MKKIYEDELSQASLIKKDWCTYPNSKKDITTNNKTLAWHIL